MKKLFILAASLSVLMACHAQKCLDLNITPMLNAVQVPGSAGAAYGKCSTTINDHHQTVITSYGTDLSDLDNMLQKTSKDFNEASLAGMAAGGTMPAAQDVNAAKNVAAQLQNMTPEQQRQWAMQMAQQQSNRAARPIQDNAEMSRIVFNAQDVASHQLTSLNQEFAAKLLAVDKEYDMALSKLKLGSFNGCPSDKTGLPYCDCVNEIEGQYWSQVLKLRDEYNDRKAGLFKQYLPQIKVLTSKVDEAVAKCKGGDALKSAQLRSVLQSAQSSAFASAFSITASCMKDMRKSGSDVFVNHLNCEKKVYNIGCATK